MIAKRGEGPIVLLGTHYDTRPLADRDPNDRTEPVPGANDGASGVGVLLELARTLDTEATAEMGMAGLFRRRGSRRPGRLGVVRGRANIWPSD